MALTRPPRANAAQRCARSSRVPAGPPSRLTFDFRLTLPTSGKKSPHPPAPFSISAPSRPRRPVRAREPGSHAPVDRRRSASRAGPGAAPPAGLGRAALVPADGAARRAGRRGDVSLRRPSPARPRRPSPRAALAALRLRLFW